MKKALRQSIMVHAKHVDKNPLGPYFSANKGPHIKAVEQFLTEANAASDQREREAVEALYAKYGGDPADLPWNSS